MISFAIRIYVGVIVSSANFSIEKVLLTPTGYPTHLENVRYWISQDISVITICLIVSFFKLFKFFELNDQLNLLTITLMKSAANLGSVIITILLSLCSFSLCGWLVFGYDLEDFKDFQSALSALFRMMIGANGNYDLYYQESKTFFVIFFLVFICINFLVCINMVFAVIEGKFTISIPDVLDKSIGIDFYRGINKTSNIFKKVFYIDRGIRPFKSSNIEINQGDDEIIDKLKQFQIQHKQNEINRDDIRRALRGAGEETISRIMSRYDIDGDGSIELVELERISKRRNKNTQKDIEKGREIEENERINQLKEIQILEGDQVDESEKNESQCISSMEESFEKILKILKK